MLWQVSMSCWFNWTDDFVYIFFLNLLLCKKFMSLCFRHPKSKLSFSVPVPSRAPSSPLLRWRTARVTEINEKHNHNNMKLEAQFGSKGLHLGVSHCVIWCKGFVWVNQNVTSTLTQITCWTAVCRRLSLPDVAGSVMHLANNNPFHLGERLPLFKALLPLYLIWSSLSPGKHFPFLWMRKLRRNWLPRDHTTSFSRCVCAHALSCPLFLSFPLSLSFSQPF